jgi:hypothetical protein
MWKGRCVMKLFFKLFLILTILIGCATTEETKKLIRLHF